MILMHDNKAKNQSSCRKYYTEFVWKGKNDSCFHQSGLIRSSLLCSLNPTQRVSMWLHLLHSI